MTAQASSTTKCLAQLRHAVATPDPCKSARSLQRDGTGESATTFALERGCRSVSMFDGRVTSATYRSRQSIHTGMVVRRAKQGSKAPWQTRSESALAITWQAALKLGNVGFDGGHMTDHRIDILVLHAKQHLRVRQINGEIDVIFSVQPDP